MYNEEKGKIYMVLEYCCAVLKDMLDQTPGKVALHSAPQPCTSRAASVIGILKLNLVGLHTDFSQNLVLLKLGLICINKGQKQFK